MPIVSTLGCVNNIFINIKLFHTDTHCPCGFSCVIRCCFCKKGVSDLHPIIAKLEVTKIEEEQKIPLSNGTGFIKILKE